MHVTPIQVRLGDTDALGHVNNAVYATYAETARIAFFRDNAGLYDGPGAMGGFIIARLAIDFRSQVRINQRVEVETSLVRLGNTSLTLSQIVRADGVLAAEIEAVAVCFDYGQQKPVPIPARLRELGEGLLAAAV